MQNKNNNQKGTMTKIRMNTELRNKLFNKIKNVFENEDTQEKEAFLQARETVDQQYTMASELAKEVVERSYPTDDVATLRHFKKKYGSPCDVVAKDKCFYFAHSEDKDDEGEIKETNLILILVCLAITMVVSTTIQRVITLHLHTLEKI